MSLEQAILDRLEKRNAQIAQLQSTVHALERASDSQREHAIMERGRLLEENKTLAERIERMEESSGSQEALQRKDAEIQEWLMQLEKARNERDAALREAESLRSQVPLESTREALKNAVAKLQEVTTDRDRVRNELATIYAEANKSGYCNGDPVAQIKKGQHDADKVVSLTTELQCANDEADDMRKRLIKLNEHARMKGMEGSEGVAEFITRLQHMAADRQTALDRAAETIAKMGTGEVVKHPVIDWQFVAVSLQNEIARLNAKVGPLEKLYEVVKKHVDHGAIIDNRADIYDAVAETAKALSQLTA